MCITIKIITRMFYNLCVSLNVRSLNYVIGHLLYTFVKKIKDPSQDGSQFFMEMFNHLTITIHTNFVNTYFEKSSI